MTTLEATATAGADIIDGKAFAAGIREKVAKEVAALKAEQGITARARRGLGGRGPGLTGLRPLQGQADRGSRHELLRAQALRMAASASHDERCSARLQELNADPAVQRHPRAASSARSGRQPMRCINAINPDKDVDGFHVDQCWPAGNTGQDKPMVPCTPLGLPADGSAHFVGDLTGKHAMIVGRSNIVGKPMAQLLLGENCTVTIVHSRTKDLPGECRQADILVAAVGRPEMIKGDWVKPGALVLDVGINRVPKEDGKHRLVGDVDFEEVKAVAGAITPVPGGIGPMTIACLLANTVTATCRQNGLADPDF